MRGNRLRTIINYDITKPYTYMTQYFNYSEANFANDDATIAYITPETAKEIMNAYEASTFANRTKTPSKVRKMAEEMKSGEWVYTGEPIIFDNEGILIDGQHRMSAVINSGTTQKFVIVFGLPRKSVIKIDSGSNRPDNARITIDLQDKNYHLCSAIIKQKLQFDNGCASYGQASINQKAGDKEKKAEYLAHKEFYLDVVKYAKYIEHYSSKNLKSVEVGSIYAYLVLTLGYEEETIKEFFNHFTNRPLAPKVINNACESLPKAQRTERTNIYLRTFNAYMRGNKVRTNHSDTWFLAPEPALATA